MSKWNYKISIKQYLTEDETVEAMEAALKGITRMLTLVPIKPPEQFFKRAKLAIREDDIGVFNLAMDVLYDWGDENRVWLG